MVGEDGMEAVFLIIQHSPDINFQLKMLPEIKKAAISDKNISGQEVALLTDRTLIKQGHSQLYGTQFELVDGDIVFKPIQNEAKLDERRKEVGLPPIYEYVEMIKLYYKVE